MELWRARRVLLTGHTGFKGSWLSLWLQEAGADLCGYALDPPTDPSLFEVADVSRGMRSEIGDIRDTDHLRQVVRSFNPEIVFHLAAQPLVRRSYRDPHETFSTNVMGTVNLFEALRDCTELRAVVVVTSDKVYENQGRTTGYREDDSLGAGDPYSASKACTELVTASYRRSFFEGTDVRVASVRAGNVIGGGDWAEDRLIPDILATAAANHPVVLRYPSAVRPWQHVLDPLSGYLRVAEELYSGNDSIAGAWNFGPNGTDPMPVSWVAERLLDLLGSEHAWQAEPDVQFHEAGILMLDSSHAIQALDWAPLLSLDESLRWIVEWHEALVEGRDMRALTARQIHRYQSLRDQSQ